MTKGHQFLLTQFNTIPTIGWQIDTFGHAATQAKLFALMGFDAIFMGRIEYSEHDYRNSTKQLEFTWRPFEQYNDEYDIFTHVLINGYCWIQETAWEFGATPIQDNPNLPGYNVKEIADSWASAVKQQSYSYASSNIMVLYGCDFTHMTAQINFDNMDKLIKYINNNPNRYHMNVFYSTPSTYYASIQKVRTGDFMPYADYFHSYWTGYYTSRPTEKSFARIANGWLRTASQLLSLSEYGTTESGLWTQIDSLSRALALFQHHDAITGTDRDYVASDFMTRISGGISQTQNALDFITQNILGVNNTFEYCLLMNESKCDATESLGSGFQAVAIVLHNSVCWDATQYVNIPIPLQNVTVLDPNGNEILAQITSSLSSSTSSLPFIVTFSAQVPAMGYAVYVISASPSSSTYLSTEMSNVSISMSNDILEVLFENGLISKIINNEEEISMEISQNLKYYIPSLGQDQPSVQASGAYIFRPNNSNTNMIGTGNPDISYISGPLFQQVTQTWAPWASQTIRLYHDQDHLDLTTNIGPIPVSENTRIGKEIITFIETDMNTNLTFYSDSQGMHFLKRVYNERSWPNAKVYEPVSGNYYPSSVGAFLMDQVLDKQLTVIHDHARGVASIENGNLEFMIHRRLLMDDNRGIYQPLDDDSSLSTSWRIWVTGKSSAARKFRPNSITLNRPLIPMFTSLSNDNQWQNVNFTYSFLVQPLPENVFILNFDVFSGDQILLRLQHIFDDGEDAILSQPVVVNLLDIFVNKKVSSIEETTLTTLNPLPFQSPKITLNPMQIRTFLVTFKH